MPRYKYSREDVIRSDELREILMEAGGIKYLGLPGQAWQAFIAILWLFGKRVSEVIPLRVDEVGIEGGDLVIRFKVLKKREEPSVIKRTYTKRITLENPFTKYVTDWRKEVINLKFLFPRDQTKMGYIYRQYAHTVLKAISPKISPHLFRHSLATQMAENGATAYELVNWFDWDQTDSALKYIRRSGRLTQRLSDRKW